MIELIKQRNETPNKKNDISLYINKNILRIDAIIRETIYHCSLVRKSNRVIVPYRTFSDRFGAST